MDFTLLLRLGRGSHSFVAITAITQQQQQQLFLLHFQLQIIGYLA